MLGHELLSCRVTAHGYDDGMGWAECLIVACSIAGSPENRSDSGMGWADGRIAEKEV